MLISFTFYFVVAITLNVALCSKDFIEYPLYWSKSRMTFGFPPHFRVVNIFYLDEWAAFEKKWLLAWHLVKGANYEVPVYLRSQHFLPDSMRKHCSPGKIPEPDENMLHDFTQDDFLQKPSIREKVSKSNSYWFGDWLNLFVYLYNICYCLRGQKTNRTCPNACWRPKICDDPNSQHICKPLFDESGANQLYSPYKSQLGRMYSLGYECLCRAGFYFSQKSKKCLQIVSGCNDRKYGRTPCRNGGVCQPLSSDKRPLPNIPFKCSCPPAWRGYLCEKPRNPCRYIDDLCGPFPCVRDPNNEVAGYACRCTKGYEPKSESNPTCVNVNECEDPFNTPCLNGGVCHDLVARTFVDLSGKERRFRCECRFGFTGTLCEKPPPPVVWSPWGEWSLCSVECGIGVRNRTRACPRPGECFGKEIQITVCAGRVLTCEDVETKIIDGKVTYIYRSETSMLKQSGIMWTPEDEAHLVDAFSWSEQQREVKYRGKDRGVRNESIAAWVCDVAKLLGLQDVTQHWTYQQLASVLSVLAAIAMVVPLLAFMLLKLLEILRR